MNPRFDEAWAEARTLAAEWASTNDCRVTVVRDILGRAALVVDDRHGVPDAQIEQLSTRLQGAAGRFAAPTPVLRASALFEPDSILQAGRQEPAGSGEGDSRLRVADHGIVGGEWDTAATEPPQNRVTLYGFKGGVGRSTATFLLAQHLAGKGYCVLVVDLDLESPGVGPLFDHEDEAPEFGLIDHIVEAAVGNEDDLDLVAQGRTGALSGNGEVWVCPAGGRPRPGYDYLAKLNRVYTDLPGNEPTDAPVTFAARLEQAITAAENAVAYRSRRPDVVLLDSRAGIHDIAAVAITRLSGQSLLFAVDNAQTWAGYRALFSRWQADPAQAVKMRDRLRMVAPFIPAREGEYLEYLRKFRDHSQECFADTLYDEVGVGEEAEAFHFTVDQEDAPHSPLPIRFVTDLVGRDLSADHDWFHDDFVQAAYRAFLEGAEQLIVRPS